MQVFCKSFQGGGGGSENSGQSNIHESKFRNNVEQFFFFLICFRETIFNQTDIVGHPRSVSLLLLRPTVRFRRCPTNTTMQWEIVSRKDERA